MLTIPPIGAQSNPGISRIAAEFGHHATTKELEALSVIWSDVTASGPALHYARAWKAYAKALAMSPDESTAIFAAHDAHGMGVSALYAMDRRCADEHGYCEADECEDAIDELMAGECAAGVMTNAPSEQLDAAEKNTADLPYDLVRFTAIRNDYLGQGFDPERADAMARCELQVRYANEEAARSHAENMAAVQQRWHAFDAVANRDKVPQAELLAAAIRCHHYDIAGTDGRTYLAPFEGSNIAVDAGSQDATKLAIRAWRSRGLTGAPGRETIAQALNDVTADAVDLERVTVPIRVAPYRDGFVYDLGRTDGWCVILKPGKWHVAERSPVPFRRNSLIGAAPDPLPIGSSSFRSAAAVLNLSEPADIDLIGAWCAAAITPGVASPILRMGGAEGSAKTTNTRNLTNIVDPSPVAAQRAPSDPDELLIAAAARGIVAPFDNMSRVTDELSDALCRIVTGDASTKRKLYTDADVAIIAAQRAVIMNGITLGRVRSDLADRMLPIDLRRLESYDTDAAVAQRFADVLPALLSATFDSAAACLAVQPSDYTRPTDARMAGFADFLARYDTARGTDTLGRFRALLGDAHAEAFESDPFARIVLAFMGARGRYWEGAADALRADLRPYRDTTFPDQRDWDSWWPSSAKATGEALRRAEAGLKRHGITVARARKRHGQSTPDWTLTMAINDEKEDVF